MQGQEEPEQRRARKISRMCLPCCLPVKPPRGFWQGPAIMNAECPGERSGRRAWSWSTTCLVTACAVGMKVMQFLLILCEWAGSKPSSQTLNHSMLCYIGRFHIQEHLFRILHRGLSNLIRKNADLSPWSVK